MADYLAVAGNVAQAGGSLVNGLFGALGSSAQSAGYSAEGTLYRQAANIADENTEIEKNNVTMQQYEAGRAREMADTSAIADTAANGFQFGGSSEWILRQNAAQSALAQAVIGQQGAIQENAYQTQHASLLAEAAQADAAAKASSGIGSIFGSILGAAGSIFGGPAGGVIGSLFK